jgi:hypothetical protein
MHTTQYAITTTLRTTTETAFESTKSLAFIGANLPADKPAF